MKKTKDYKFIIALGLFVSTAVIGLGLFVNAQANNNLIEFTKAVNGDKDVMLAYKDYFVGGAQKMGAYIADPTRLTDLNVTNDLVVDGITSLGLQSNFALSTALEFPSATTTENDHTGHGYIDSIYSQQNTTGDKLCWFVFPDITTATGILDWSLNISTSTVANATTSAGTVTASSTVDSLYTSFSDLTSLNLKTMSGNPGSFFDLWVDFTPASTTKIFFPWDDDDYLNATITIYNATSPRSLLPGGGFIPAGNMIVECKNR